MNELGSCALNFANFAMLLDRKFSYVVFGKELNSGVGYYGLEAFCDSIGFWMQFEFSSVC